MDRFQRAEKSAEYLRGEIPEFPSAVIILGSGLGVLAETLTNRVEISYGDIPHFPQSTAPGHDGKLAVGGLGGKAVAVMSGRFHFYEGYDMSELVHPIRVFKRLGVKTLLITNAAGGINTAFEPGDLMVIDDHIKMFDDSPLRGPNDEKTGPRFNDMSAAYSPRLREIAHDAATACSIPLRGGVYAFMPGPSYETPAEIRMLRILGADAVGMSTVPEAIAAAHAGIETLGISCISNMAAGILPQPLTHEEVMQTGFMVRDKFIKLLNAIIERM